MTTANTQAGQVIVRLVGEHDLASEQIDEATLAQAAEVGDGDVVVDLGEVTFMSVGTVGILTRLGTDLLATDRHLMLRDLSPSARRVLAVTGSTLAMDVERPTPQSGAQPRRGCVVVNDVK